jgi:hypothetical protein
MADLQSAATKPQVCTLTDTSVKSPTRPDRALTKPIPERFPGDADLSRVVEAWPALPDPIRAAILNLANLAWPQGS